MKLAYLTNARLPSRAANNVQVMKMCEAFSHIADSVTLLTRVGEPADPFGRYGVAPRFRVVQPRDDGPRGVRTARWAWGVRRVVRELHPTIVYSRDAFALAATCPGIDSALVFEAHWSPRARPSVRRVLQWLVSHPRFSHMVAISRALRDELLSVFPALGAERVVVAPSGADPPADAAPRPLGGRPGALRVGYCGHAYPGKGADEVVALAGRCPAYDFHLVGGDDADLARLRPGAPANVRFWGHQKHSDIAGFLASFDVVLAPYQREVFVSGGEDVARWMSPLKIVEYMAAGRAIVASALPAIEELLVDKETALLVPPRDLDAWTNALRTLEQPAERARRGHAARAAAAQLGWDTRARRVLRLSSD